MTTDTHFTTLNHPMTTSTETKMSNPDEERCLVPTLGRSWQWGIGLLTTTHRTDNSLARTLESYRGSGFAPPIVFTDANKNGGLWNLYRALTTLVEHYPDADAYIILEDDVLFSQAIREYLEAELWPSVSEHGCLCSLFTPTLYSSAERWHVADRLGKTWVSQCRIYHPRSAKKFVADFTGDSRLLDRWRKNDVTVGEWANQNGIDVWFHSPSLTQHILPPNTSYGAKYPLTYRIGLARDFIGERLSAGEYWQAFGTATRPRRCLPRLEIVARSNHASTGVSFQFTPEMAHNLANALNHYNCDIGELSFVGDDLFLWKYAGRCVYPLRMTGKVMRMRLTLQPKTNAHWEPYKSLFDTIDVDDDGSNPDMIDQCVSHPYFTVRTNNQESVHGHKILRLIGNEVFLCSRAGRHAMEDHGASMPNEHRTSCGTLDEFFQHFDTVLAALEPDGNRTITQKMSPFPVGSMSLREQGTF